MMQVPICSSVKPTWKRLYHLFLSKNYRSITRSLQYEHLEALKFEGRLLDVGGGDMADYRDILDCQSYESLNINSGMKPSFLIEVDTDFGEFGGLCEAFDCVLSMNTLEHVLDAETLLQSIVKTLRDGGHFYAATPFLYPVHGSPDDFFRPTASWWFRVLSRNGFKDIDITPLIWGPFSTGALCSGLPGPLKKYRMLLALILDLFYIKLKFRGAVDIDSFKGQSLQNFALGYFVKAQKGTDAPKP